MRRWRTRWVKPVTAREEVLRRGKVYKKGGRLDVCVNVNVCVKLDETRRD